MHIAVTGGSGFIGSHVVDALVGAGHDVLVVDEAVRRHRRAVSYVEVDVLDLPELTAALAGCDVVFHLAGVSNVDIALRSPAQTVQVNVLGTTNVAEAARQCGLARVILASTVWVYGAVLAAPGQVLDEAACFSPERAGHVYTSSKLAAELVLHSYRELYDLPFTVLRYGIPYGPRMRDELVVARFVQRALRGEPLTIAGDGEQHRNYVYVGDLAAAHVLALADTAVNETFTLQGPERITIRDIVDTVRELLGDVRVEHVPARQGDYEAQQLSTAKAARLLGWAPTTSFRDGLSDYLAWYREGVGSEAG